jgi:hypothetical protein
VGEYKTAESLGFAGVLNPGKESDKVYAIVGVKGVGRGEVRRYELEKRIVIFRRAVSVVSRL